MKANELMVGDWVHIEAHRGFNAQNVKVETIPDNDGDNKYGHHYGHIGTWLDGGDNDFRDVEAKHLQPIPLTPEILEKNGFRIEEEYDEIYDIHNYYATLNCVDSEKRNVEVNYSTFGNEITIFCHDRQNVLLYRSLETQIKHVHELQHIFKILKIEKEIVL